MDQRDPAIVEMDHPAEQRRVGGVAKPTRDRDAACGGEFVARQPDKGIKMAFERGPCEREIGARAIGERHGRKCQLLERVFVDRDQNIVRQRS